MHIVAKFRPINTKSWENSEIANGENDRMMGRKQGGVGGCTAQGDGQKNLTVQSIQQSGLISRFVLD